MNRIDSYFQSVSLDRDAMRSRADIDRSPVVPPTKDAISILEDAREEIGMHHAEKLEGKVHEEREFSEPSSAQRMTIAQIESYLDATQQYNDPLKRADLVAQLQRSMNPRALLQRQSLPAAHQYSLLQLALYDASKRLMSVDVLDRLGDALDALEHESGDEIHASLNSGEAAAAFSGTAEGFSQFQKTYVDAVLGQQSLAQTLTAVLQRLSGAQGEDFPRALKSLLQALGADMGAARPSTNVTRLEALVSDIYQLEVATSVLEGCTDLSRNLLERFDLKGVDPFALMQSLVAMTGERWVPQERWRELARKFQVLLARHRIAFQAGAKKLLGAMPVKVFPDLEARLGLLDSAQEALDECVAQDEEAEGQ